MDMLVLVKEHGADILSGAPRSVVACFMDEKPGIVRFSPRPSAKSPMMIAVAVALAVQVALCSVLVAIHFQELWTPQIQNGVMDMEMVQPAVLDAPPEEKPSESVPVNPVVPPPTVSHVPKIASDEDLLAVKLPENEDCSEFQELIPDDPVADFLPEELSMMRISMKEEKRKQSSKPPAVSLPGRPDVEQNMTPDKKVRYKHAPSLPNSVNSSKVGKINAVVKVVVGVTANGEPSSVNILQSTGNAELDRLFMRWLKENWSFYPAEKDGVPIASKVVIPVRLNID